MRREFTNDINKSKLFLVVSQYYEVQVYDEFVISGNTAVLKCHVPSFVKDHVTVTSWQRGNGEVIVTNVEDGKISMLYNHTYFGCFGLDVMAWVDDHRP